MMYEDRYTMLISYIYLRTSFYIIFDSVKNPLQNVSLKKNMARIKLVILDDDGSELRTHEYKLISTLNNLTKIERAVEQLRPQILGDVTQDLLEAEQKTFTKKEHSNPTDTTA